MLNPGTRIGPFEIVSPLGAGGMGEVYRARDSRLARCVALKVLPETFARDGERMARFEREAKVLASLNHPNIASIYGLEESDSTRALVMELVEGPTLAERIDTVGAGLAPPSAKRTPRGAPTIRPMPLDEALPIARQIAEGLEYAHERGIIHRDLKPSNVKLTPDGQVKLLDFGLAKALEGEGSEEELQNSPTVTAVATESGVLLGTAAYMSPEQARGKRVDRRTDIWAFGCVLYEMLTGQGVFTGETTSDILACVLRNEPDWDALPPTTPAPVRKLIRRCLNKDPRQRLQAIGDARIAIEETLSGAGAAPSLNPLLAEEGKREARFGGRSLQQRWRRALPWAVAGSLLIAAVVSTTAYLRLARPPAAVIRATILPPEKSSFDPDGGPAVISPDGTRLAFVAQGASGQDVLWVRPLETLTAEPLPNTEGARYPFWSPDSRRLGFFAHGKLRKVDASGGPAEDLADAPAGVGGSWSRDGVIIFSPIPVGGLKRVSAAGGSAAPLTQPDPSRSEVSHRWPQFLPDGRHFLFFATSSTPGNSGIFVGSLDGGQPKFILATDSNALYAAPGYLLFVREHTLMAERFDLRQLKVSGDSQALAGNVGASRGSSLRGDFSVSETGAIVYQPSGWQSAWQDELLLLNRAGKQVRSLGQCLCSEPAFSPDGRKLALVIDDEATGNFDIWIDEIERGARTRVTFNPALDAQPAWSPDGSHITFFSLREGKRNIYEKAADGTGTSRPLMDASTYPRDAAFSSDGRFLAAVTSSSPYPTTPNNSIWIKPLSDGNKPYELVRSSFVLRFPQFSPDGKWLAYSSNESGRWEVYIAPFPSGNGKWEVSNKGGYDPKWRKDGRELYYLAPDDEMMAVDIKEDGSALSIGTPHPLFQAHPVHTLANLYDVSADGKEFVIPTVSQAGQRSTVPAILILNWPALLKNK